MIRHTQHHRRTDQPRPNIFGMAESDAVQVDFTGDRRKHVKEGRYRFDGDCSARDELVLAKLMLLRKFLWCACRKIAGFVQKADFEDLEQDGLVEMLRIGSQPGSLEKLANQSYLKKLAFSVMADWLCMRSLIKFDPRWVNKFAVVFFPLFEMAAKTREGREFPEVILALEKLSPKQAEAVRHVYGIDAPLIGASELARKLEVSRATVRKNLQRGLDHLRGGLEKL